MSKHNKVNPGQYTQAGRLSADDAAREYSKQTQPGIGHRDTTAAEHRERKEDPPADKTEKTADEGSAVNNTDKTEHRHEDSADVDSSATRTDGSRQKPDASR
jgi:hypothetical protein